jgi:hypothetical protein
MSDRSNSLHIGSRELALYVIDALDAEQKDTVERHVLACDACADGLAREARVEAALEQVARMARVDVRRSAAAHRAANVISLPVPPPRAVTRSSEARLHLVVGGRRSRWAGGIGGALAAAAALVLAFASTTARSEPVGVAQRMPALHDAAGDMSGAFGNAIEAAAADSLDGG